MPHSNKKWSSSQDGAGVELLGIQGIGLGLMVTVSGLGSILNGFWGYLGVRIGDYNRGSSETNQSSCASA